MKGNPRRSMILLYVLSVVILLVALWYVGKELVFGFNIPKADLEGYAAAELGWTDAEMTDVLEQGTSIAYKYEDSQGRAGATVFRRGAFGEYKLAGVAEFMSETREMSVLGTEERFLMLIEPGSDLGIVGKVQTQSWFGMVIINLILCWMAFYNARKLQKAMAPKKGKKK